MIIFRVIKIRVIYEIYRKLKSWTANYTVQLFYLAK